MRPTVAARILEDIRELILNLRTGDQEFVAAEEKEGIDCRASLANPAFCEILRSGPGKRP
jgi:hypothetical protein